MAGAPLVGLVFDAWADLDRVAAGVPVQDLLLKPAGGSAIAWSVGHVTNQLDGWVNVRFAGLTAHDLIGSREFRDGDGRATDWEAIRAGVAQVRSRARAYLERLSDHDLVPTIPYDGSIDELREGGISLRYALMRIAVHHYFHIGEIAAYLGSLGRDVGPFPSHLTEVLASSSPS